MSGRHKLIPYREKDHGTPLEEWAPHSGVWGWWYCTGCVHGLANPQEVYFYQYTGVRQYLGDTELLVGFLGFNDYRHQCRIYELLPSEVTDKFYANEKEVVFPNSYVINEGTQIKLQGKGENIQYDLILTPKKDPVWHGDKGVLTMGHPEDKDERTVYYSYTNLKTSGTISYRHSNDILVEIPIQGKTWFDRQWGPFKNHNWDWFSFRFFDDEEIMIFAWPNQPDFKENTGTYVDKTGKVTIFSDYSYTTNKYIRVDGLKDTGKIGLGWNFTIPYKDKNYQVIPVTDNQLNRHPAGCYWEGLCDVINPKDEKVGYCIVEIVPEYTGTGVHLV